MKRPLVKWLVRVFATTVVVSLLIGAVTYWNWRSIRKSGESRLATVESTLDADEPGWRGVISRWNASRAPKDRNSAWRVLALLETMTEDDRHWFRIANMTDRIEFNQLIPEADLATLKLRVGGHRATAARFHELIRTDPESGLPLDESAPHPLKEVAGRFKAYREGSGFLTSHATLNVAENNPDEAVRDVRTLLGIARAIGDDPSLYGQLERMKLTQVAAEFVCRVIGTGDPKTGLADLQAELASAAATQYLAAALPGERLTADRLYEAVDDGRAKWAEPYPDETTGPNPFTRRGLQWTWYRQHVTAQRAVQHELFTQYSQAMKTPYPDRLDALETVRQRLLPPQCREDEILLANLSPAVVKLAQTEIRTLSITRLAVVAVACERFRLATGRWPKDLGELAPAFLTAVPDDPYTGGPVSLHRVKTGLVAAGFGSEPDDDDMSFSATRIPLFDVTNRRQPPTPITTPDLPDIEQYRNPKP